MFLRMTIPPPLLEAMAQAALSDFYDGEQHPAWASNHMTTAVKAMISAAARAGYVLVPRDDLIEAAGLVDWCSAMSIPPFMHAPLAARLRQAAGDGATT